MARYSPTVRPRSGREGEPRAADRIIQALDMLRRDQIQEEERELADEERERRRELTDLELAQRGIRRGEAPTRSVPADETALTGDIDLGGAPGGARTRRARELESVLFPGTGPAPRMETDRGPGGMAGAPTPSPGGGGPLVDELEGLKRRGPTLPEDAEAGPRESRGRGDTGALGADEFMIQALDQVRQQGPTPRGEGAAPGEEQDPAVRHPPGAFVPEAMDFTTEPIFDMPEPDTRIGLQRPPDVEVDDPRFEQLTDEFFVDRTATPQARESARQARMLESLGRLRNATPEQMEALQAGVDPSMVFAEEEEAEGFTEDELRRAGVPEDVIPAGVQDPILARRLIQDAQDPEDEDGPTFSERRYAREQVRDRAEALIEDGAARGMSAAEVLGQIQEDPELRDVISTEEVLALHRESAAESGEPERGDDFKERRETIKSTELGPPKTALEQRALDMRAEGKSNEEVLEMARSATPPPSEEQLAKLEEYLSGRGKLR